MRRAPGCRYRPPIRLFSDGNMPLPPTVDSAGPMPSVKPADTRPRYVAIGPGDNGDCRALNERPFEHHQNAPAVSPYMLLYNSTANGTISTYNAYVRPALPSGPRRTTAIRRPGWARRATRRSFSNHGEYYPVEPERQ